MQWNSTMLLHCVGHAWKFWERGELIMIADPSGFSSDVLLFFSYEFEIMWSFSY